MFDILTLDQFQEWQAYDAIEPIGEERIDVLVASVCSIITNIARQVYGTEKAPMTTMADFIPIWDVYEVKEKMAEQEKKKREQPAQPLSEMKAVLEAIAKQAKGRKPVQGRRRRR